MKDMAKEFESKQGVEILPRNFEELTGGEAGPILEWASRRLEIVHGTKKEFWKGVKNDLDGLRGWIEGNAGKLQGKTIRVISGVVLAAILMTASLSLFRNLHTDPKYFGCFFINRFERQNDNRSRDH